MTRDSGFGTLDFQVLGLWGFVGHEVVSRVRRPAGAADREWLSLALGRIRVDGSKAWFSDYVGSVVFCVLLRRVSSWPAGFQVPSVSGFVVLFCDVFHFLWCSMLCSCFPFLPAAFACW